MKVFSTAILMVFCSLLGSAFSIKCRSCSSLYSPVCEGDPVDCPGDRCVTISQFYQYGDQMFYSVFRGCGNRDICNTYGSMTQNPNVKFRAYVSCCKGDNCNTDKFNLPDEDTKPNGVKCPTAFCEGTTEACNKDVELMDCRGPETCCFDYRGRVGVAGGYAGDYSLKGCINPNGCKYNFQYLRALTEIKRRDLKCCKDVKP